MVGRVIQGHDCLAEGAAWLASREPRFASALQEVGPLPLRLRPDGFASLLDAIVSQQVSVAAADAIWGRLKAARLTGPRNVARASEEELRACGLSRQKVRYAKALATSGINYTGLRRSGSTGLITSCRPTILSRGLSKCRGSDRGRLKSMRCSALAERMSLRRAILPCRKRRECSSTFPSDQRSGSCA